MNDYKIQVKNEMEILNIMDKAPLLGYHVTQPESREILTAKYLIIGNYQGVRWCDKRVFDTMHEDYILITTKGFLEL